ncbi:hypothetical protein CQA49_07245 [Helicobacter sp. MIT 00-7814]|nr:hypothetical protein CQA37_08225 [Helicobacter sp. MIT 99-10781]RDU53139.1 hypothetical protein CQA49_07245 [Helicobacter sp. MIT 00-7814]
MQVMDKEDRQTAIQQFGYDKLRTLTLDKSDAEGVADVFMLVLEPDLEIMPAESKTQIYACVKVCERYIELHKGLGKDFVEYRISCCDEERICASNYKVLSFEEYIPTIKDCPDVSEKGFVEFIANMASKYEIRFLAPDMFSLYERCETKANLVSLQKVE